MFPVTISNADIKVIAEVVPHLKQLRADLMMLFPEREWLINQIILALIMGEHVLVYSLSMKWIVLAQPLYLTVLLVPVWTEKKWRFLPSRLTLKQQKPT